MDLPSRLRATLAWSAVNVIHALKSHLVLFKLNVKFSHISDTLVGIT